MAAFIYGTQARVYGVKGNVAVHDGTATVWPTLTANAACIITAYNWAVNPQGQVQGLDQYGRITSEAIAFAQFDLNITFEFGSSTTTPTEAEAEALIMPAPMAKLTLENFENTDVNGAYNFISGSIAGSNQGWKVGNMVLRAISNGSNLDAANKGALSALS